MIKLEIYTDELGVQRAKYVGAESNINVNCCIDRRVDIEGLEDGIYDAKYFDINNYSAFSAVDGNGINEPPKDSDFYTLSNLGEKELFNL